MLHVSEHHKATLISMLTPFKQYDIRAYGSRVKGTHHKNSDLDLCVMKEMPQKILASLREQFSESNVPFFVTIVPWSTFDNTFKTVIQKDLLPLNQW